MLPWPSTLEHAWTPVPLGGRDESQPSSAAAMAFATEAANPPAALHHSPAPELHRPHPADYSAPYAHGMLRLMPPDELLSRPTAPSFHASPSPHLPVHLEPPYFDGHERPNGLSMLPGHPCEAVGEPRGAWATHDRRKAFRITSAGVMSDAGDAAWSHDGASHPRRASWASPATTSCVEQHLPPTLSSTHLHVPQPAGYFHQHLHQPFVSPSPDVSTYPSYPIRETSTGPHDLSLPFRDFPTSQVHTAIPPASPYLPHPHPLQPAPPPPHLAAASIPLSAYLPSHALVPSTSQQPYRDPSLPGPPSTNPSSAYIPSANPSVPSQVVVTAAANRNRVGGVLDITGRRSATAKAARRKKSQPSIRRAVELDVACTQCTRPIGKLTLRGGVVDQHGGEEPTRYRNRFFCPSCLPLPPPSANGKERELAFTGYTDEAVYEDTLSGAVDRLQGLDLSQADIRPPPAPPGKSRTGFITNDGEATGAGKKRRASALEVTDGILGCDVCRREIGSGDLSCVTGEPINASIEVLCAFCETRYLRCSDCGGGGGTKGVGRWRCKEMFPLGRRTCQLVHTRLGLTNEMDYDVWPIGELTLPERDRVSVLCHELYNTTIMATLAIPDMLESPSAIVRSFEEVEKVCTDSWTTYDPLIQEDVETTTPARTKRYIALRWSTPTSRKKKSRAKNPSAASAQRPPRTAHVAAAARLTDPTERVVLRERKTMSGFILAEHDLEFGTLHLALTLPTGAGEAYDATTRLQQTLIGRVFDDLEATNAHRVAQGLQPYPPLSEAWTMHMTKRDSRIMSRVETRRGFIPLDDYLAKYTESKREHFMPIREAYLPPELLRGWVVYAKRITCDDFPPDYVHRPIATTSHSQHDQHLPRPPHALHPSPAVNYPTM
ncbi:hypothetical protein JCM10212_000272 [Sporobolomyces blumeae]